MEIAYYQRIIILIALFLCGRFASGQVITGVVCDKTSRKPVTNVSVYLDGTSTQTITDTSGRFRLTTKSAFNTRLVVHHLSFKTLFIDHPFEGLPDTLFIEDRAYALREVTVTADTFTREQKMKAFREQFLGVTRAGKSCVILNEDDIQLHVNMNSKKLFATSDNPIVVVNPYLGYQVEFILVDFWVQYGFLAYSLHSESVNSSFFAVTSSFTDLATDSRRIKRRRDNVYEKSSNHFFKSLADDALKENKFTVFEKSLPIKSADFFSIKDTLSFKMISLIPKIDTVSPPKISDDSLKRIEENIINGLIAKGIFPPEIRDSANYMRNNPVILSDPPKTFTLNTSVKNNMTFTGQKLSGKISVLQRRSIQSDIYFMTDSFLIDRYGNIDKIDYISYAGEISKNRAGDMLPIDYEPATDFLPSTKQMTLTIQGSGEKNIFMTGTGKISIDWGDGTPSKTHTLARLNEKDWGMLAAKYLYNHTYTANQPYTITIKGDHITHLACLYQQLTNLDIANNTELTTLFCPGNQLDSMDLSSNIKLKELYCFDNPIKELNLQENTALTHIVCGGNLLRLDVSHNTALVELNCLKNPLMEQLDVSCNKLLKKLDCSSNQLTSLKISPSSKLTLLKCADNRLSANTLNELFDLLPGKSVSGEKYIFINNNPGTEQCDTSIATGKGWKLNK